MSYKNVKGILVEIGGDTSALQNALKKVDSATSSLSKELRGINSLLKLDPSNTELVSQKQIVLAQEINKTEEQLRNLEQAQKEADDTLAKSGEISQENYRALQQEIIRTQQQLKKLQLEASNWTKVGKKAEEFGNIVVDISSKVENLGNKLSKVFTTSIVGLGTIAVKSAVDFETAFTGVEKTVDATEEQLEELKQGIKDMAKEIPSSTTEISAIAEAAGQLGIETENILDFSKAMLDLGNSTNLTAEDAATQLARFANITQMSQKDFDKLGSSIVDLGNNFATTESEIVDMAMRLAGAGKQVGFSEGQILGLATALSSVGVEAEMGGSAISKAMVKMQNAVENGGAKLNKVLKDTGLSLRELELMSTNDTMGFKELAQSVGMTTTEIKQLITAGTNLEDFAKVSGMTVEQFKKAWKDDAAGALNAFIKGLGDAESKGQTAITMLSEMGLTEVRLRDSLLRATNAGTLLSDAIKTGTKAFDENVALTNEANKRYATLESRVKTTLSKTNNLAISLGEKLKPSINKIMDKVDGLIDKLDNLTGEEIENVIQIGLMVAAIGPLIKILGMTGTTIGKVSKGIGTFSQAVAVMKAGTESGNTSVDNLAKGMKALISPAGLAVVGVTALVVAFQEVTKETRNYADETQSSLESANRAKKSIDELKSSIDNQAQAELYEIDRSKDLWTELQKITDENGKIKKGYEGRAKVITGELSKALGEEITITDNVIDNYKELQKEIDKLILKKKAEIILSASEEKYQEAIKNRTQKTQELLDKQEELNEAKRKEKEYQEEYQKSINAGVGSFELATKYQNWKNQADAVKNLNGEVTTLTKVVDGYTQDMQDYQYNFELYSEGTEASLKELSDSVLLTYTKNGETVKTSFTEQIKEQEIYLTKAKELNDKAVEDNNETETKKTQTTIDESNKRLDKIIEELTSQTSLVENDEDIENAWESLATDSYDKYSQVLSKMPPEMQNKIQEMTGIVANDESVEKEVRQLAEDTESEFNNNIDPEKWGKDIVQLLTEGVKDTNSINKLELATSSLASMISRYLHFSVPDVGPLSDMDKSMPDMIDLMAKGIDSNKNRLVKSAQKLAGNLSDSLLLNPKLSLKDFSNVQGKLNNQIINSSKVVNNTTTTTLQPIFNIQGTNAKEIAHEVNRQLGKLYS